MRWIRIAAPLIAALPALAQTPCEKLASLKLPGATITAADPIAAGAYRTQEPPNTIVQVPAFCRVAATLRPTADSSIDVEVWLPDEWNGKYEAVGGGGWAGSISFPAMAAALAERLHDVVHRHGAQGRRRDIRTGPSRKAGGFFVSRRA